MLDETVLQSLPVRLVIRNSRQQIKIVNGEIEGLGMRYLLSLVNICIQKETRVVLQLPYREIPNQFPEVVRHKGAQSPVNKVGHHIPGAKVVVPIIIFFLIIENDILIVIILIFFIINIIRGSIVCNVLDIYRYGLMVEVYVNKKPDKRLLFFFSRFLVNKQPVLYSHDVKAEKR